MRTTPLSLVLPLACLLVACDDGASPGAGDGDRTAAAFEEIADSIAGGGDYARAEALRHAARIVRLVGEPTPVTLTIGGEARSFVAVAEELEYPMIVCTWPADSGVVFPDSGGVPRDSLPPPPEPLACEQAGSARMRTLIAWEPGALDEVVRLVAQEGSGSVEPGVPDAMAGPSHEDGSWGGSDGAPADSAVPPVGTDPGFMGEYLRRDHGFWMSVSGTQANALEGEGGACREETTEFDWARYRCEAIRVRFEFAMRMQELVMVPFDGWDPANTPPPAGTLDIAMPATAIAGARLSLLEWLPPPLEPGPGPDPMPGDSTGGSPGMPGGT
jgi:hypothetical protein